MREENSVCPKCGHNMSWGDPYRTIWYPQGKWLDAPKNRWYCSACERQNMYLFAKRQRRRERWQWLFDKIKTLTLWIVGIVAILFLAVFPHFAKSSIVTISYKVACATLLATLIGFSFYRGNLALRAARIDKKAKEFRAMSVEEGRRLPRGVHRSEAKDKLDTEFWKKSREADRLRDQMRWPTLVIRYTTWIIVAIAAGLIVDLILK